MDWRLFSSLVFAVGYVVWIWRGYKGYSRSGVLLCAAGSLGICIFLTDEVVRTLPSHAPLHTITGLATNKTSSFLSSHSDFILIEAGKGRRTLFTTSIKGPWADQPVRVTYADDGRFIRSVSRIEILNSEQFPWHVEQGHAGWVGNAEARRRPPLVAIFIGFVLIMAGALATTSKRSREQPENNDLEAPAE